MTADTLQPIETAPKDGRFILLAGPSGYHSTPLRFEACHYTGYPFFPWRNHANDAFSDGGADPTHWMPLPTLP